MHEGNRRIPETEQKGRLPDFVYRNIDGEICVGQEGEDVTEAYYGYLKSVKKEAPELPEFIADLGYDDRLTVVARDDECVEGEFKRWLDSLVAAAPDNKPSDR